MARLDRKRAFGTVHPPENGAVFCQDGRHFNTEDRQVNIATGELVEPNDAPVTIPRLHLAVPQPGNVVPSSEKVDLVAWGRGEVEYLWGDVAKAFVDQYGRVVTNKRDAVDTLIEFGAIQPGEARTVE